MITFIVQTFNCRKEIWFTLFQDPLQEELQLALGIWMKCIQMMVLTTFGLTVGVICMLKKYLEKVAGFKSAPSSAMGIVVCKRRFEALPSAKHCGKIKMEIQVRSNNKLKRSTAF